MDLKNDISVQLHPFMALSKNLMEHFCIIGYKEEVLQELLPNIIGQEQQIKLSLISTIISDSSFKEFDFNMIIDKVYPEKPKIIKNVNKPSTSSIVFSTCIKVNEKEKEIERNFYSGYALRFYELYQYNGIDYYVPKSFLIISQYPYFTQYHILCSFLYENFIEKKIYKEGINLLDKGDKKTNNKINIPIELFIYCLLNYIPSPFNNELKIKLINNKYNMTFPKLSGYPYIDFDLCKIIREISFSKFLEIYILIFLEIPLIIFSDNIEKLNILLYALYILNYPLTDTFYLSHIYSISKDEMKYGFGKELLTFRGINTKYSRELNCSKFKDLNFVFDADNKKLINITENRESKNIETLLELDFLDICYLEKKFNDVKKEWKKISNTESYFNINKKINETNKKIQEIFYDFILNVLTQIYKKIQFDESGIKNIKINDGNNLEIPGGEKIFFVYFKRTDKFIFYFQNYIIGFEKVNIFNISRLFCDEVIYLKKNNDKTIKYFNIIDSFYNLEKGESVIIDEKYIYEYYKLYHEVNSKLMIKNKSAIINNKKKETKLFRFDKDIINNFIYFISNNKNDFDNKIIIQSLEKRVMASTYWLTELELSLIYIYIIIFPLLTFKDSSSFLKYLLDNCVSKIKFFQRYYIYLLLKTLYIQYYTKKDNINYNELNFGNLIKYYEQIKAYLLDKKIIPNEEILFFLKSVLHEKKENLNNKNDKKVEDEKNNKKNEDDANKKGTLQYNSILSSIKLTYEPITMDGDYLILQFMRDNIKYNYLYESDIYSIIYELFFFFLEKNFDTEILENKIKNILDLLVNVLYILGTKNDIALYLWKVITIFQMKKGSL